ncbi:PspC domain-containing protein [Brumimicrobium glaciale]|uniref:PspC domain-containing protein n=1 Tax=Brumimicrobium glaciale TaxID=200475 RepID=A0A4Q4KNZ0_9FLAO|nr:PspC domain-containing protein [Brumimicrobium glaciale]RYM35155.1 PspC domain-containing protein [Brumimicrobium glaciale]
MKKTTTINLAGMVYHIEEDAFQVLNQYIADIKRVFSNQEGVEEMVADIQFRIAELFQERLNKNKEVVTYSDVQEVMAIMGSPNQFDEDFEGNEEEQTYQETSYEEIPKRLYRDTDEGMLGGVSAGMANYFNIDPVIIRVLWIVLVLAGGSGVLIYIIAWIAIPEAKTTAQKLQMKGQSANIDNIRAFADSVKNEAKTGFKRASKSVKNTFKKKDNPISNVAKAIGRVIGFGLFLGGILGLVFLVLFFLADFNFFFINNEFIDGDVNSLIGLFFTTTVLASWLIFAVSIIPLIFLIIAGGMLLFNQKPKSRALILTLLILWFVAIVGLSFIGIRTGLDFKETYKSQEKTYVEGNYPELQVNIFEDEMMITNAMDYDFDRYLSISENEVKLGYARIEILPASDSLFYYSVEKRSNGGTLKSAKENSEEINFDIEQVGNVLNVSAKYGFPKKSKIRGQKVDVKIYVPVGRRIILNGNLEDYPIRLQTKARFNDDLLEQSSIWESSNLGMEYKGFLE